MVFKHGGAASHEAWFDARGRPGRASLVDTSFTHSAFNDLPRDDAHFLHFDVWHPDLTAEERAALALLDETYRRLRE